MVKIVADTTCGLPRSLCEERGIPLLPQVVIFGDQSFHDDRELDTAAFLQKLKASPALPKTSAPEPGLYQPIFREALEKQEAVIVIAPSNKISGTVRSAQIAAQDFPSLDVRIVDSLTASCNLGSLVLVADDMSRAGCSADEIVAKLNDMIPRGRIYFVVDTLEYLAKGGRIGGARALLGELIQIKPILTLTGGQAEAYEQQRTRRNAVARLLEIAVEQCTGGENAHLSVLQVAAEEEAQALVEELKARIHVSAIPIYELPPAIVVHAGPKAMGLGFFL